MSKSYPVFLFVIFLALFAWVYQSENNQLQLQQQQELTELISQLANYSQWQGSGAELYQLLSVNHPFQFFQYIDDNDSGLNHTYGSLVASDMPPLATLFSLDLAHTQKLLGGRLQVKLGATSSILQAISHTQTMAAIILGAYLLSVLVFSLLLFKLKRSIDYSADYIAKLPQLTFPPLESSKLSAELAPIGSALEECCAQLKNQRDTLTQENEKLQKAAFQDPVTGFSTRVRFTNQLASIANRDTPQLGLMA
ncbi:MAG: EAL domain-containing protein, partial [Shewanella sp.]